MQKTGLKHRVQDSLELKDEPKMIEKIKQKNKTPQLFNTTFIFIKFTHLLSSAL